MKIKRLIALVLALTMIFSATAVLAADLDLTVKNPDGTTKTLQSGIWPFKGAVTYDMNKNPENYQVEVSGKNYKVDDVKKELEKTENEGKPLSEIVKPLTPVTPPTPTENLEVKSINFNDAKTGFVVNFNRAVLATEKATLKIEVLQGGTPILGQPPHVLAENNLSATVDFGKALSGKYTVKVTNPTFEKELEVPSAEAVFTLKAVHATKLEVEFVKAIPATEQSKLKFAFTRNAGTFTFGKAVAWDATGKKATFEHTSALPIGTYEVSVTNIPGVTGAKTAKVEVKEAKLVSIEILNKKLAFGKDNVISYKAKDQYGEVTVDVNDLTFMAYNQKTAENYTFVKNTFSWTGGSIGDTVLVSINYKKDVTLSPATATLTIAPLAIATVELGEIIPAGTDKRVYVGTKGIKIKVTAKDNDGNDYLISDKADVLNKDHEGIKWNFDTEYVKTAAFKDGYLILEVKGKDGKSNITLEIPAAAKTKTIELAVGKKPHINEIVFAEKSVTVSKEGKVKVGVTAKDQYGDDFEIKTNNYDFTTDFTQQIIPVSNQVIVSKYDKAKKEVTIEATKNAVVKKYEIRYTESTNTTGKVSSITVDVKDYPAIKGIRVKDNPDAKVELLQNETKTIVLEITDEFGNVIKPAVLNNYGSEYTISATVSVTPTITAPTTGTINKSAYQTAIKYIAGATAGDTVVKYEVKKGTTVIASVEVTATVKDQAVVDPDAYRLVVKNLDNNSITAGTALEIEAKAVKAGATDTTAIGYNVPKQTITIKYKGEDLEIRQASVKDGVVTIEGAPIVIEKANATAANLSFDLNTNLGKKTYTTTTGFTVTADDASKYSLSDGATAGTIDINAVDAFGNLDAGYKGTKEVTVSINATPIPMGENGKINVTFTNGKADDVQIKLGALVNGDKVKVVCGTFVGEYTKEAPVVKYTVTTTGLADIDINGPTEVVAGEAYTAQLTAQDGYVLPTALAATSVIIGGNNKGTECTLSSTGVLSIPAAEVKGNIVIAFAADCKVTINAINGLETIPAGIAKWTTAKKSTAISAAATTAISALVKAPASGATFAVPANAVASKAAIKMTIDGADYDGFTVNASGQIGIATAIDVTGPIEITISGVAEVKASTASGCKVKLEGASAELTSTATQVALDSNGDVVIKLTNSTAAKLAEVTESGSKTGTTSLTFAADDSAIVKVEGATLTGGVWTQTTTNVPMTLTIDKNKYDGAIELVLSETT